jgi:fumarate reductase subunit C
MSPSKPGRTRTAPPQLPDKFPMGGRYLAYTLFDWTGLIYFLLGFLILADVWALGSGDPDVWKHALVSYKGLVSLLFHVLALVSVIFVGVRFFSFFPKAQPPRIGPLKPPPKAVILVGLYVAWIGIAGLLGFILAGGIF